VSTEVIQTGGRVTVKTEAGTDGRDASKEAFDAGLIGTPTIGAYSTYVASLVAGSSNATTLNNQPASYYTNASNLSTGTLPVERLPAITFASLTGKPTTIAGYGITDAVTTFAQLGGKPTTLAGYGITNAQPLDADLTALAALTGTNTVYYRSAPDTWSPVTFGTGLTFSGGTLTAAVSSGTVTSVAVATANGVSGTVTNPNTTPSISITLGAITPTSVAATGMVTGSNITGTNTGDQTITLTGDVTGSGTGSFATTLATVNSTPGQYGSSTAIPVITVDGKGRITAIATAANTGGGGGASGTVTSFAFTNGNGFTGTVTNPTTTPTLSLTYNGDAGTLGGNAPSYYTNSSNQSTGTLPAGRLPALTGDVTTTAGSAATTIAAGVVTLAKQANVATGSVFYRKTAGTGAPEVQALATLKTDLGLTGTNSGDQTDITGNAGTATKLQTARAINTVPFDGTAAITITANWNAVRTLSYTGDASGSISTDGGSNTSTALTLATVNTNTGSFGNSNTIPAFTVNGKGLVTAVSPVTVNDTTKQPLTTPYLTPASTTTAAGLRVPPGTAPTSPQNGDVWTTAAGIYVQINGATVGPLSAGSGSSLREQTISCTAVPDSGGSTIYSYGSYKAVEAQTATVTFDRVIGAGGCMYAIYRGGTLGAGQTAAASQSMTFQAGDILVVYPSGSSASFAVHVKRTA